TAKCAQTSPTIIIASTVKRSMRDVRGVFSSTAARTSLTYAKSDCRIGLQPGLAGGSGGRLHRRNRLWRGAAQAREHGVARPVGYELAALEQEQAVDEPEERGAMGRDNDRHL